MQSYNESRIEYEGLANYYAQTLGLDPAGAWNGDWDAFRHAFVSASFARDYGADVARALGDLTELKGDLLDNQPANEKNMDLWNNSVGRRIGLGYEFNADIAREIMDALERGDLIRSPDDPRQFDDGAEDDPTDPSDGWPSDWDDYYSDIDTSTGVKTEIWTKDGQIVNWKETDLPGWFDEASREQTSEERYFLNGVPHMRWTYDIKNSYGYVIGTDEFSTEQQQALRAPISSVDDVVLTVNASGDVLSEEAANDVDTSNQLDSTLKLSLQAAQAELTRIGAASDASTSTQNAADVLIQSLSVFNASNGNAAFLSVDVVSRLTPELSLLAVA